MIFGERRVWISGDGWGRMAGRSSVNFRELPIGYINLVDVHGKCREIYPTWMLWVRK